MSKYIIDTDQFEKLFETKAVAVLGIGDNLAVPEEGEKTVWTRMINVADLEELTSDYINEHYGELQDEAYQKGINDGSLDVKQRVEGAYQRGLDDAWEAARKIAEMWETIDNDELLEIFGLTAKIGESTIGTLFKKQTASEAIAKLKAYEEKQKADNDKFEFGDEIIDSNGVKGCVISMNNEKSNIMYALFGGYRVPQCICQKNYRKTGKHYDVDDIKKLLEEMRHD